MSLEFPAEAVFQDGALGKSLGHEFSDFMNGLTHWGIQTLNPLLKGVGESFRHCL
jgi:hypothetical protein